MTSLAIALLLAQESLAAPRIPEAEDVPEFAAPPDPVDTAPLDLRVSDLLLEAMARRSEEPVFLPTLARVLLFAPSLAIEGLASVAMPERLSADNVRLFDRGQGREDIGWIFTRTLVKREISFLAGLGSTAIVTDGVEQGREEIDSHRFDRLQTRVFFDSLKRSYRERFGIPNLDFDTVVDAVSTGSWVDTIAVPALFSVYAAKYGVERKIRLGEDVRVQLSIEKGTRFYKVATQDHGGRLAAFAVNLFDLPVSAIVSIDSLENGVGIGFIGIGTDLSAMVESVYNFKDLNRRSD